MIPTPVTRRRLLQCGTPLLAASALRSSVAARLIADPQQTEAPELDRLDLHGNRVRLPALHGGVVLLNFWATWCAPCLAEMPVFSRWQGELGRRGLHIVGIAMDDEAAPVRRLLRRRPPSYPVVMGDAALAKAYGGVLGLPVTVLLGRDGTVRHRYESAAGLDRIRQDILQALG